MQLEWWQGGFVLKLLSHWDLVEHQEQGRGGEKSWRRNEQGCVSNGGCMCVEWSGGGFVK
jgi:hypothetical protein